MIQTKSQWLLVPLILFTLATIVYLSDSNRALFAFFNAWQLTVPGVYWAHITTFGDTAVAVALMLVFADRRPDILWSTLIAVLIGAVAAHGLKALFGVLRPPGVLPASELMVYGPVHIADSFPSGHTLTAWTLTAIVFTSLQSPWRWTLLVLATLVGISRMALGVHWPLDVLVGAGIGWLIGQLAVFLSSHWPQGLRPWPQRLIVLLLGADAIALFWYHNGHPQTFWMQYLLAGLVLISVVPKIKPLFWQRNSE